MQHLLLLFPQTQSPSLACVWGIDTPVSALIGPDAEERIPTVRAVEPGLAETSTVWWELMFISARLAATRRPTK